MSYSPSAAGYAPVSMNGTGWAVTGTVLGIAEGVGAVALGILVPPLGVAMLAAGVGYGIYDYSNREDQGQSGGQAFGGTVADLTGVNEIYSGWTGNDIATGQSIGADDFTRGQLFGGGLVQFATLSYAASRGLAAGYGFLADEVAANNAFIRNGGLNGGGPQLAGVYNMNVPAAAFNPAAGGAFAMGGGWGGIGGAFGSAVFSQISRNPWISQALQDGVMGVRTPQQMGIQAPPDHHLFPQAYRSWFEARGVNIDNYTVTLDQATHDALHYGSGPGQGGGWWNDTIMMNLYTREANAGRMLTADEILEEGQKMMVLGQIDGLSIHPWNSTK